jgi:hypothetical protein
MTKANLLLCAFALWLAPMGNADTIYSFSLDTTSLGSGPFALDFQFLDGSGTLIDLNNNTVSLTNFTFGTGGSASGGGTATNGASGSLASGVTLQDSAFFNEYFENFTPGTLLAFTIDTTNVADPGGTPDLFSIAILDSFGAELPTTGPASELVDISLTGGAHPEVTTYGSLPGTGSLAAPTVQLQTSVSPVPEPAYAGFLSVLLGLSIAARRTLWSRKRQR